MTAGGVAKFNSIIIPMQVETTTGDFGIGTAVTYSRQAAVGFEELASGDFAKVGCHKARVYDAILGSSTTYPYGESFGITKAAGKNGDVVPVVVAGFAVCRVRFISANHSFVRPAVVRETGPVAADLRGCLETTRCGCEGTAKLLMIGAKPQGVTREFNWATAIL